MLIHRMTFIVAAGLLGCTLGLIPNRVHAQYNYYQSGGFAFNQFNYPPIGDNTKYRSKKAADAAPTRPAPSAPDARPAPVAAPASGRVSANNNPLPYTRDAALSVKIREEFLRDYATQMPDDAKDMRATTERTDFVQIMAGFTQGAGLDSGTMEGVMALWYGQSWAIIHQKPLPTKQQYQGIAAQLKSSNARDKWNAMSNAQRQAFYEHLAYPLFVQKANYTAYLKRGNTDAMARMATATRAGLKQSGVHLDKMDLGEQGFVKL